MRMACFERLCRSGSFLKLEAADSFPNSGSGWLEFSIGGWICRLALRGTPSILLTWYPIVTK